ncbi:MAG: 1-deoxy-D-xylulose-5-phosphate synthase [Deltaproteobacteria bacterium]|nr:MAG: 1-deoxy-D-xylulose-5-phosphate synthase [Deltaproteobacteria bacterium]
MGKRYKILDRIDPPKALKTLSVPEMEILAGEVREFILEKLSPIGGHLASSLGVVELTIALHATFNTPEDRIVWDVGHQSYGHKILTGRRDEFANIRQRGGISGFPKRSESEYDCFGTGHASTSISAGVGMAVGKDLAGRDNKVIAVIGDGSMTSGMAFEGLNHGGHLKGDLIVVLNDNEMSISPNVGALASYLSRVLSGNLYSKMRSDVQEILKSLPGGEPVAKFAKKIEEHAKGFISPGMLFEELGFTYFGPINGHNISHLLTAFKNVSKFKKPILVHVVTTKGKGYVPAEEKPSSYHGVGPFDLENGNAKKSGALAPSYTSIFGKTLVELASSDNRIVAITAAMTEGTGLKEFAELYPKRFFDVGIAEEHAVTFAAGLAVEGQKPVVAIYSTFLQRAYDQIIHDVALQKLDVVFALDRAGFVGSDGATHHGSFDLSYLRHIPGMTVIAPSDENELRHALATALSIDGPVALRYPRGAGVGALLEGYPTPFEVGRGRMLIEGGEGAVALINAGANLPNVLQAVEMAKEAGVKVSLFDARFVKPLDKEAILALAKCSSRMVTIEENALQGGFGSAVVELLADEGISIQVKRLGIPDLFISHGTQNELREEAGIDASGIAKALIGSDG